MKLNNECIKAVLNYVCENVKFDFESGKMSTMSINSIIKTLSEDKKFSDQEIVISIIRSIREGLLISNYYAPKVVFSTASIEDITFRGISWLDQN